MAQWKVSFKEEDGQDFAQEVLTEIDSEILSPVQNLIRVNSTNISIEGELSDRTTGDDVYKMSNTVRRFLVDNGYRVRREMTVPVFSQDDLL